MNLPNREAIFVLDGRGQPAASAAPGAFALSAQSGQRPGDLYDRVFAFARDVMGAQAPHSSGRSNLRSNTKL